MSDTRIEEIIINKSSKSDKKKISEAAKAIEGMGQVKVSGPEERIQMRKNISRHLKNVLGIKHSEAFSLAVDCQECLMR